MLLNVHQPVSPVVFSSLCLEKVPKSQPQPVKLYESSLDGPLSSIADLLVKEELARSMDRSGSSELFYNFVFLRTKPPEVITKSLKGSHSSLLMLSHHFTTPSFRPTSTPASPTVDDSAIWDPPLDLGPAQNGVDSQDQKSPEAEDEQVLDCQLHPRLPTQLKDLKVRVCHVNSPSSFYVQLTQHDSQLKRSAVNPRFWKQRKPD